MERILESFHGRDSRLQSRFSQRLLLRHDVDHNLNLALRLAERHAYYGTQATFFIRTDTSYAQEDDFLQKIEYLSSLGHEIGYHCNAFYTSTQTKKPLASEVQESLELLRKASKVTGVAAHGDKHLYEAGVSNLWTWHENKSKYLARAFPNKRLNAEGTIAQGSDKYLETPQPGSVSNDELSPEFSVHMKDFGLDYEAVFIGTHRYWSDSGGKWIRTGEPTEESLDNGYHQVLIHPEYVFRAKKPIFFFSFGEVDLGGREKILANAGIEALDKDEFLNRTRYEYPKSKKVSRTSHEFNQVARKPGLAKKLFFSWLAANSGSKSEIRASLEPYAIFLEEEMIKNIASHADCFVFVQHPVQAVLFLAEAGWHAQPLDARYPMLPGYQSWERQNQIEKLSLLWAKAYEKALNRIPMERIIKIEDFVDEPKKVLNLIFPFTSEMNIFADSQFLDVPQGTIEDESSETRNETRILTDLIWSHTAHIASKLGYSETQKNHLHVNLDAYSLRNLDDFYLKSEKSLPTEGTIVESQSVSNDEAFTFFFDVEEDTSFIEFELTVKNKPPGVVYELFEGDLFGRERRKIGNLDASFRTSSGSFRALNRTGNAKILLVVVHPIEAELPKTEILPILRLSAYSNNSLYKA